MLIKCTSHYKSISCTNYRTTGQHSGGLFWAWGLERISKTGPFWGLFWAWALNRGLIMGLMGLRMYVWPVEAVQNLLLCHAWCRHAAMHATLTPPKKQACAHPARVRYSYLFSTL